MKLATMTAVTMTAATMTAATMTSVTMTRSDRCAPLQVGRGASVATDRGPVAQLVRAADS
jgi:hypothetical protein